MGFVRLECEDVVVSLPFKGSSVMCRMVSEVRKSGNVSN